MHWRLATDVGLTLALSTIALVSPGCSDSPSAFTAPDPRFTSIKRAVAQVVLAPGSASLPAGGQQQFTATAYNSNGGAVSTQIFYSATGGTITSSGVYTAGGTAGTYQVIARAKGSTAGDTAAVVVTSGNTSPAPTVGSVSVAPSSSSLSGVGTTVQLTAQAYDGSGNLLSGQSFSWTSSNTIVATVSGSGLVTAAGSGSATITATDGTVPGTATVSVTVPSSTSTHSYSTNFPRTENPISEGGVWINGGVVGLDWSNVATVTGLAYGLQSGASYTDATALLTGTWGPTQTVTATVYSANPSAACYPEVEMRLRSSLSAHVNNGYEISFSAAPTQPYLIIVRWNGALGDFTYLLNATGPQYTIQTGDVVSASIQGNMLSAYRNGVLVGQATDSTYTGGNPGMGFNLENAPAGCSGTNQSYGYSSFSAHD